jgi:hypothetical protein
LGWSAGFLDHQYVAQAATVCLQGPGPSANERQIIGSRRKSRGQAPCILGWDSLEISPKEEGNFWQKAKIFRQDFPPLVQASGFFRQVTGWFEETHGESTTSDIPLCWYSAGPGIADPEGHALAIESET